MRGGGSGAGGFQYDVHVFTSVQSVEGMYLSDVCVSTSAHSVGENVSIQRLCDQCNAIRGR